MAPSKVSLREAGTGKKKVSKKRPVEESSKLKTVQEWTNWTLKQGKVIAHWGIIPTVIVIGMFSEPRPTWGQILSPF